MPRGDGRNKETPAGSAKPATPMEAATPAEPREPLSRDRIIAAAIDLVDESGLEGLSMRALGRKLGVEAMALYHYFPSKAALIEELAQVGREVEAFFGAFFDEMEEVKATAGEQVVALGHRYIEFAEQRPAQFTLLFNTLPIQFDTWEEFMVGKSTFEIPQMAVQAGIDSGEFHPRPGYGRDEMAYNLWALVHGLAVLRQTRLRNMSADYYRWHTALLEQLVQTFRGWNEGQSA